MCEELDCIQFSRRTARPAIHEKPPISGHHLKLLFNFLPHISQQTRRRIPVRPNNLPQAYRSSPWEFGALSAYHSYPRPAACVSPVTQRSTEIYPDDVADRSPKPTPMFFRQLLK